MFLRWRDPARGDHHASVGTPATTVNVSGAIDEGPGPAITVGEVRRFLTESGIADATVIDGGICPTANHLTVVDCADDAPRIVRHGVVHERAIAAALDA